MLTVREKEKVGKVKDTEKSQFKPVFSDLLYLIAVLYVSAIVIFLFPEGQRPAPLIKREKHFKVLLIGDPNVGKTSFVQRYANDTFRGDYKGTVGVDFALKVLRVSGETVVKLQLWDVAGISPSFSLKLPQH